jgi:glycosyltransferase involved in cell wall biosynthesis
MKFMSRPKVIVFSDWFVPGYRAGGPIKSLKNLIATVPCDFLVFTRITDYHSTVAYDNIEENIPHKITENCTVQYIHGNRMNVQSVFRILKYQQFDRIYLNSLFSSRFTLIPLLICRTHGLNPRVILAPRGMLKSGALTIKPWKKTIFLKLCKFLYSDIMWHATNEQEKLEVLLKFPKARVIVAPVIPSADAPSMLRDVKIPGRLRLVTFSRVSSEKGVLEAIKWVNELPSDLDVVFDIYGAMPQGEYLELCREEASKSQRVQLKGEVNPSKISEVFSNYEVFFLPTWGENYGHAIAEALLNKKPIVISNRTPWRHLESFKAGFDVELTQAEMTKALIYMAWLDEEGYKVWSEGAFAYAQSVLNDPAIVKSNQALFE